MNIDYSTYISAIQLSDYPSQRVWKRLRYRKRYIRVYSRLIKIRSFVDRIDPWITRQFLLFPTIRGRINYERWSRGEETATVENLWAAGDQT